MGEFMIGWFLGAFGVVALCVSLNTTDSLITSGKKIKIDNAVYVCKQTQKLDLENK